MNYKIIDKEKYYRKGVYRHFTKDCKCSTSMTGRIDVTPLKAYSEKTGTKFYVNFLYILSSVLNSREDYRMGYLWQTDELICYDQINPTQYIFHEDTETCTPVYTVYYEDYTVFYEKAVLDIEKAKETREYGLDMENHPNWFDASFIPWFSYDSLNIELPDGYLFFAPIVNWGKYRQEDGRLMMPVSVRLNHAIAEKTNLSRPAVSHHMQILKEAGIVTSRKEGTRIYYLLNPEFDSMHKMSILFSHIETLIKYDQSERENKK